MDNSAIVAAFGAVFLPLVIAWLRDEHARSRYAALLAFAVVAVWTVLALLITGDLDTGDGAATTGELLRRLATSLLAALVSAHTAYRALWQPIGATSALERRGGDFGKPTPSL